MAILVWKEVVEPCVKVSEHYKRVEGVECQKEYKIL
jgi:hypothetical protein